MGLIVPYATLPEKIRAGIDRRSITSIVLLKESTESEEEASLLRETVFDRLNTGGIKLERQEIRNALYRGPFRGSDRARSLLEEAHQYWLKSRYPQADPIRSAIALDLARIDESRDPREQLLLANDPAPRNIDWNLPDLAREYFARAPKEATNLFVEALQGYGEEMVWVSKLPWAVIRILPEVALTDDLIGAAISLARRVQKDGFVWFTISALWNRTDLSSSQRRMFYAS